MTGAERDDDLPDDTMRVLRGEAVPDDHTVRVARSEPVSASDQASIEPDDAGGAHEPIDAADAADPEEPDDATVVSQGRAGRDTEPYVDPDGTPGPRRHAAPTDADEPDDGSTMVARRESRRRAAREVPTVAPAPLAENSAADLPAPIGRIAQAPGETPPIYKPRAPEPIIAERSAPPSRPPQVPVDTRAEMLFRRRRARQLALVGVIAGAFVVTVLVAALVTFTTSLGW